GRGGAATRWGGRGGGPAPTDLHVPIPLNCFEARRTGREALDLIAALARDHTDDQIAEILNERGIRTGTGRPFTGGRVDFLRKSRRIPGYYEHLRRSGLVTGEEIRTRTGISGGALRRVRRAGLVRAVRCDRKHGLYENPSEDLLSRYTKHRRLAGGERTGSETRARGAV